MTTIENNVPIPAEKPKRATRARKAKAVESPAAGLVAALEFVSHAQQKEGTAYQTHCKIEHNWLIAFNGILSMGVPVAEDLHACPRTFNLLAALSKCKTNLSITQLNESILKISSEKFQASVDCLPFDQIISSYPDQAVALIDNNIKTAFEALAWIATENAPTAFCASILLQARTAVATNRHVICEYWHGNDLPPDLLIPKQAAAAIVKINKNLKGFGYTPNNSATFWFEDGSYLKTQLFNDRFPQYEPVFAKGTGLSTFPVPEGFFEALEAVTPFCKDKFVHFKQDKLCSHEQEELGATYQVVGLNGGMTFNYEYLQSVKPFFDNLIFPSSSQIIFAKGMLRGAMMGSA